MRRVTVLLAAGVLGLCGCQDMLWCNRGPLETQRQWDEIFDPYPDPDIAPAIVGGRPREYDKPIPEPARARVWPQNRAGYPPPP